MTKISIRNQSRFNRYLILEQLLGETIFKPLFGEGKRRLQAEILAELKKTPEGRLQPVERRRDLSPEEFRSEYYEKSRPVVMEGVAKDWPCCRKWSLDYFELQYGNKDILLVDAEGLSGRNTKQSYEYLSLRQLIENIRSGGDKYLRFSPLLQQIPVVAEDIDLEWLLKYRDPKSFGNTYYMFVGGKGTKTQLHNDQPCNLYVQVHGEKRWTLYPVEFTPIIDPQVTKTAYYASPIDRDNPDLEKHPMFRYIDGYEVILKPGDVMYVPPHMWHHVANETDSIAVAYRFSSLRAAFKASPAFTFLRATSMNPPLWKTMKYGRKDTNLIWAHTNGVLQQVLEEEKRREASRKN